MEGWVQDIRYGVRRALKQPAISAVIVFILALGIGASGALFSVINGAFLHPFAYIDINRFLVLNESFPRKNLSSYFFSVPELVDIRNLNHVFDDVGAIREFSANLIDGDNPERVLGAAVTANIFSMTGNPPVRGRSFSTDEDRPGGNKVVVISYRLWQRRYGGNAHVFNKSVILNNDVYTIVGVMPQRYLLWDADVWTPLALNTAEPDRAARNLFVTGLLKSGMTIEQASADLQSLSHQLEQEYVNTNPDYAGLRIAPQKLQDAAFRDLQPTLLVMLGAVILVLLISYANVTTLLLARMTARYKEIAIRLANGASRFRITRLFIAEAVLLSVFGSILSFFLIRWSVPLIGSLIPSTYISPEANIGADYLVLVLTLGISLIMGIAVSLVPALQSFRFNLADALKEGGRKSVEDKRGRHARNGLVVIELAMALVVLVGAGLMIKSYLRLTDLKLGFNPEGVLTMRIALPQSKYSEDHQVADFYKELVRRVSSLPGVGSSAAASGRPMSEGNVQDFAVEGRPQQDGGALPNADYRIITPDYFTVTQISLREGRLFTEQDRADAQRVAIINETMARLYWPVESPIGKRIKLTNPDSQRAGQPAPESNDWWLIVGVVGDARQRMNLLRDIRSEFYLPFLQRVGSSRDMALMIRTTVRPTTITEAVRQQVLALDSQQPVYEVVAFPAIVDRAFGPKRLAVIVLAAFAGMALVLATVGLYAIIANSVTERTHEIGVRMALGAQQSHVLNLVIGQGLKLILVGLFIGLLGAFGLSRVMSSMLFGVSATDSATFVAISLLLIIVAILATYIPARKATKVDPMVALRFE